VMAEALSRRGEKDRLAELFGVALVRSEQIQSREARIAQGLDLLRVLVRISSFPGRERLIEDLLAGLNRQDRSLEEATKVLLQAGRTERALAVVEKMSSAQSQGRILVEAARVESRKGNQETACNLLRQALAVLERIEPGTGGYSAQLMLFPALCEIEDEEAALALAVGAVNQIRDVGTDSSRAYCLSRFGKSLFEARPGLWAVEVFDRLCTGIVEAEMAGSLDRELQEYSAEVLARTGNFHAAIDKVRGIGASSLGISDALFTVFRELARAGRREEVAGRWALVPKDLGGPSRALAAILDGIGEGCPAQERAGWLVWSLERWEEVEAPEDRARLLAGVIRLLPEEERDEKIVKAVRARLQPLGRELFKAPTAESRAAMLKAVVETWALLGEVDRAIEILDQADAGDLAVPALIALVPFVIRQDGPPRAEVVTALRSLAASCDTASQRASTRATLARAMAEVGLSRGAVDLLAEAQQDLEIGSAGVSPRLLVELADVLSQVSAIPGARRIFDRYIALASGLPSSDDQREAFRAVAGALVDLDNFRGIEKAIDLERVDGEGRCHFVTVWRAALLAQAEPPLPALRYTLSCFATEPRLGTSGAQCLAAALLKTGRDEHYGAVIERCPELGFPRFS